MNSGRLEVSDGGTLHVEQNLTFVDDGRLVVDGGGLLEVIGNIGLDTAFASLDVLPKAGGGAYDNHLIATYTGSLFGEFGSVTPGISVSYSTPNQIIISGTPVPEPALMEWVVGALAVLAGGRRRWH